MDEGVWGIVSLILTGGFRVRGVRAVPVLLRPPQIPHTLGMSIARLTAEHESAGPNCTALFNRAVTVRDSGAASWRRPGARLSFVLLYHRTA